MSASPSPSALRWVSILCALVVLSPLASAGQSLNAILTLKNGDRLSGLLLNADADRVTLTNAIVGKISVSRAEIERMETQPAPAPVADATVATNQPVVRLTGPQQKRLSDLLDLYRSGRITPSEYHAQRAALLADITPSAGTNLVAVKPEAGQPPGAEGAGPSPGQTPPATAPAAPVKAKGPKRWSGDAQLGVDAAFGERDRQLLTGRLKLNYAHKQLRNILDYHFAYGRTDGVLSANRMDGSMKTDYDLLKRFYVYNLGGAGYDELRRIDLRFEQGPGAGWFILRGTNYVLRAEYGVNYQAQFNIDGTKNERFYHRYAEEFTWKVNSKLSFDEKLEFFPTWGNWSRYRVRFEANARYWLGANLSFVVTLLDQYDSNPAAKVTQNDLQVRSSIGLKF